MATILEYLKAVQELEVTLYFDRQIFAARQGFTALMSNMEKNNWDSDKNAQEKRIKETRETVEKNKKSIRRMKEALSDPAIIKQNAETQYPLEESSHSKQKGVLLFFGILLLTVAAIALLHFTVIVPALVGIVAYFIGSILFINQQKPTHYDPPFDLSIALSDDLGSIPYYIGWFLPLVLAAIGGIVWAFIVLISKIRADKKEKEKQSATLTKRENYVKNCLATYPDKISTLEKENEALIRSLEAMTAKKMGEYQPSDGLREFHTETMKLQGQIFVFESQLRRLYDLNIIHEKYRSLVPVTMFYEYFETGRCTTLTGHEGAYNLYEAELRQNIIIDKLDGIKDQLEDIKKNQYYLAKTLSAGFARLEAAQQAQANHVSGAIEANTAQYAALTASTNRLLSEGVSVSGTVKIET